jgi:hypothetical protein
VFATICRGANDFGFGGVRPILNSVFFLKILVFLCFFSMFYFWRIFELLVTFSDDMRYQLAKYFSSSNDIIGRLGDSQ